MEKLMVIFNAGLLYLVYCAPKRNGSSYQENIGEELLKIKRKPAGIGEATVEEQKKFQEIHFKDYLKNKEYYQKWENATPTLLENLCRQYVLKLFAMTAYTIIIPSIMPELVPIHYNLIKDKNNSSLEPSQVAVLQCFYPESKRQYYFHYIKSTKAQCLFMVKPLFHFHWLKANVGKDMRIINEFCHSAGEGTRNENVEETTKEVVLKYSIGKGNLIRSGETTPDKRLEYEIDHFKDYMLHMGNDSEIISYTKFSK